MNTKKNDTRMLKAMRNDTPRRITAALCGLFASAVGVIIFLKVHGWVSAEGHPMASLTRADCFMVACGVVSAFVQLAVGALLIVFALIGAPRQRLLARLHDRIGELEEKLEPGESEP